jgi:hypothetical protein
MNTTNLNQLSKIYKRRIIVPSMVLMLISFENITINAQSDETFLSHFKVTADLVSHYVWRGSLATSSPTPNFQPTLAYTKGIFEIGVWGSKATLVINPSATYTRSDYAHLVFGITF